MGVDMSIHISDSNKRAQTTVLSSEQNEGSVIGGGNFSKTIGYDFDEQASSNFR